MIIVFKSWIHTNFEKDTTTYFKMQVEKKTDYLHDHKKIMIILINTPMLSVSETRNELTKDAGGRGDITDEFPWSVRRQTLGRKKK